MFNNIVQAAIWIVPPRILSNLIAAFSVAVARRAKPREALLMLFDNQARIETLINTTAVRFGEGLHPKHRIMQYHRFFVERLQPGERVLDIGSGNGYLGYQMALEAGARVLGIELLHENVERATNRFSHASLSFRQGDVLTDVLPCDVDTITMSNVLEHLPQRPALLRRLQAETGARRFLIRVPCFDRDWTVPLRKELGLDWRLDSTHEIEFTRESFAQEMQEAGLTIEELHFQWSEIWAVVKPV